MIPRRCKTIEQMDAYWHRESHHRGSILLSERDLGPLFTGQQGCLTHRTRFAWAHLPPHDGGVCWWAECGAAMFDPIPVKVEDELFICHACYDICERHGIDTFNLVPSDACSATGGQRYRRHVRPRRSSTLAGT